MMAGLDFTSRQMRLLISECFGIGSGRSPPIPRLHLHAHPCTHRFIHLLSHLPIAILAHPHSHTLIVPFSLPPTHTLLSITYSPSHSLTHTPTFTHKPTHPSVPSLTPFTDSHTVTFHPPTFKKNYHPIHSPTYFPSSRK